jgi:hypothetical protein
MTTPDSPARTSPQVPVEELPPPRPTPEQEDALLASWERSKTTNSASSETPTA